MKVKRFMSAGGIEIIVGQDSKSNDELTFKTAAPNDVWLHVKGVPGSHVVLKSAGKHSKDDIKEAAACAAYFSKMKNAGKTAVNYCSAKDVSKPKGAPAGKVRIKNEDSVNVYPKLPVNEIE